MTVTFPTYTFFFDDSKRLELYYKHEKSNVFPNPNADVTHLFLDTQSLNYILSKANVKTETELLNLTMRLS